MNIFRRIRRTITRCELFWYWCGSPFGGKTQNPADAVKEHLSRITDEANPTLPTEAESGHTQATPLSEETQSTQPSSNQTTSLWKLFLQYLAKVVGTLFGVGSTCLVLLGLWDSYRPKITITPGGTLSPKSLVGTYFIVQNQGSLPIANVEYRSQLTFVPIPGAANTNSVITTEQNVSVIPQMKALESYSLGIRYPSIQVSPYSPSYTNQQATAGTNIQVVRVPASMVLLSFDIGYETSFFGKRTETRWFFGVQDSDGNWQWLPSAHQSVLDQTIDTGLMPQAQPIPVPTPTATNGGALVHTNQIKPYRK